MSAAQKTLYQVLMVDPRADPEVIAAVYQLLLTRYRTRSSLSPESSAARLAELSAAYDVLQDRRRRAAYDEWIGLDRVTRLAPLVGMPIGPGPRASDTYGDAGHPPPDLPPRGTVLGFGRYQGWTIWQVGQRDPDYLEWLRRTPNGWPYAHEVDEVLGSRTPRR
jgi:curved DNA-binding protein CbpA